MGRHSKLGVIFLCTPTTMPTDILAKTQSATLLLLAQRKKLPRRARRAVMRLAAQSNCRRCALLLRFIRSQDSRARFRPSSPAAVMAVWAEHGASERDVAAFAGIAKTTLHDAAVRLRDWLLSNDRPTVVSFAAAAAAMLRKPSGRPRAKMTDDVLRRLRHLVLETEATSWSNVQLRDQLVLEFPHLEALHPTSVSKALAKMGITIKKPTVLALGAMRPENIAKHRDFARRFFRNVDVAAIGDWRREAKAFRDWVPLLDPDLVFFGDQSGVNRTTANARKARSLRGQPAPALRPYVKGKNHSLMLIAGHRDGIVASDIIQGGSNRERLIEFFRRHFIPYIKRYRESLSELKRDMTIRLFLDNAPIHTAKDVGRMLKDEANVELELLPPYSPVLNPCENVFSMLKTMMRNDTACDPDPLGPADERSRFLIEYVYSHLPNITPRDVRAFYHHCAWGRPGPIDVDIFAELPMLD